MGARDLLEDLRVAGLTVSLIDDKIVVAPKAKLTDPLRDAIRANRDDLASLLKSPATNPPPKAEAAFAEIRTCAACRYQLRHGTCGEPVAAGLAAKFEIRWPPAGYAKACEAFAEKVPSRAQDRPYKLSKDAADRCHAGGWDALEIEAFTKRTAHFIRHRVSPTDADDLAERLTLRDREGGDLRLCLECQHYRPGRCGNHRTAGLNSPELGRDLASTLQRCAGFQRA